MSPATPPRFLSWVLGCLLSESDRETLLGDLYEEYALRSSSGRAMEATVWFWTQFLRSVPPLASASIRRGGWLPVLGAAFVVYFMVSVVEAAGTWAVSTLLPATADRNFIVNFVVGLLSMLLGGYIAARVRRGAAEVLALLAAIAVVTLMITRGENVPLWYQIGFLVLSPLASIAGGALRPSGSWSNLRPS